MKKGLTKSLIMGVILLLIALSLFGCNSKKTSDANKSKSDNSSKLQSQNEQSSNEFYSSDEELFEVETEYAVLKYPSEYKETVKTLLTNENPYTISFTTAINDNEIKLFDIVFDGEEGYKLGTLKKDEKSVDVYLKDYSSDFSNDLSEEETAKLDAMCQKINVIISNLIKDYDFEVSES